MKTLAILLTLALGVGLAQAQVDYRYESIRNRAGTVMAGYKFAPYTDTSQAVGVRGWSDVQLMVRTQDSLSITVYYLPSYDGVNYFARVLIDSMSNAVNTGETKSFPLPAAAYAFPNVKFSWIVSAFREGTSADTLHMKVYKR